MEFVFLATGIAVGAVFASTITWIVYRGRVNEAHRDGERNKKVAEQQVAFVRQELDQLRETFKALAGDALRDNNSSFLELAKTSFTNLHTQSQSDLEARQKAVADLVSPINATLKQVNEQVSQIEKQRIDAYSSLNEQVKALLESQRELRNETGRLTTALRAPIVRGRWGEIQLRRVVEMAGMTNYCDFVEQQSVTTEEGRLRPDVIVRLPGGQQVVVDAKTPLSAFIDAVEVVDEEKKASLMQTHARQVKDHINQLGQKSYTNQFDQTPEFVVMFIPGESFFSAALEQDPSLIEHGVDRGVILATPTTLISLLRAVYYGWRQEALAINAAEISSLGKELYDRIRVMAQHFGVVGSALDRAVQSYNQAAGSIERRVLVTARKFEDLQVTDPGGIELLVPIETSVRELTAPEAAIDSSERDGRNAG